jgi:hypothetical protein
LAADGSGAGRDDFGVDREFDDCGVLAGGGFFEGGVKSSVRVTRAPQARATKSGFFRQA